MHHKLTLDDSTYPIKSNNSFTIFQTLKHNLDMSLKKEVSTDVTAKQITMEKYRLDYMQLADMQNYVEYLISVLPN